MCELMYQCLTLKSFIDKSKAKQWNQLEKLIDKTWSNRGKVFTDIGMVEIFPKKNRRGETHLYYKQT